MPAVPVQLGHRIYPLPVPVSGVQGVAEGPAPATAQPGATEGAGGPGAPVEGPGAARTYAGGDGGAPAREGAYAGRTDVPGATGGVWLRTSSPDAPWNDGHGGGEAHDSGRGAGRDGVRAAAGSGARMPV